MDSKNYMFGEYTACSEFAVRNSLFGRSSRKNELSSASSISPSMSVSIGETSASSQASAFLQINEIDRMISDQGLITPKGRPRTSGRKIRDKPYYKGLVHLKNKEICDEIRKLKKDISLLSIDQKIYIPYKKKAEVKVIELETLQKTLADYNCLDDMLNRDIQLDEARNELQRLKAGNQNASDEIKKLFDETKERELLIKEMEVDISQENYVLEISQETVNQQLSEELKKLKHADIKLQTLRTEEGEELATLKKEREGLENKCSQNRVLKGGFKLLKKLWSVEKQLEEFQSEKKFASSSEEYEYLQNYATKCSDLLKGIMQEKQNVEIRIQKITEELRKMEKEASNLYSQRASKYSKLKEQEKIIDDFLSSHITEFHELVTKKQQLECKIIELLKKISSKMNSFNSDLQNDGAKKILTDGNPEIIAEKIEYQNVPNNWETCCSAESKYREEKDFLKNKITLLTEEISKISDVDEAKKYLKIKGKKLLNELNQLKVQKRVWNRVLNDLRKKRDDLREHLDKDSMNTMLSELEKKWHLLEKENYAMENFIAFKDLQEKYLLVKNNVRQLYLELNNML